MQYLNAYKDGYIKPFELEKRLDNGQIWVRSIRHRFDPETGAGVILESGPGSHKLRYLLTPHKDGYFYSKTAPNVRGYKFYFADEPRAEADPRILRRDRRELLLNLLLFN